LFLIGGLNKKIGRFRFKAAYYKFFLYSEIKDLGVLRFENAKGDNGRPQKFALLNEWWFILIMVVFILVLLFV